MPQPNPKRNNGPIVVIVMVILGTILGWTLHVMMPRSNPKLADPGSPYYSAPSTEELQAQRKALDDGKKN